MQVDTEVFEAISARADAMDALAGKVDSLIRLITIVLGAQDPASDQPARAPKRDRHLRVVR